MATLWVLRRTSLNPQAVVLRKCKSNLRSFRRDVLSTKRSAEYQYWRTKPKSVASIAMIRFQTLAIVLDGEMPLLKKSKINILYFIKITISINDKKS